MTAGQHRGPDRPRELLDGTDAAATPWRPPWCGSPAGGTPGDRVYADGVQRAYNHLVLRAMPAAASRPRACPTWSTWAGRTPLAQWPG